LHEFFSSRYEFFGNIRAMFQYDMTSKKVLYPRNGTLIPHVRHGSVVKFLRMLNKAVKVAKTASITMLSFLFGMFCEK